MKLFALVRHGETAWSADDRLTSSTDLDLTDRGLGEAANLGVMLRRIVGNGDDRLVASSGSLRAIATAEAALPGQAIEIWDGLHEADFGTYEGLSAREIGERVPGWNYWRDGCPGGEAIESVAARAEMIRQRILREAAAECLIFGHGVILRAVACALMAWPVTHGDSVVLDTTGVLMFVVDGNAECRLRVPNWAGGVSR